MHLDLNLSELLQLFGFVHYNCC